MARKSLYERHIFDNGAITLYKRPNTESWQAACKLSDGSAMNPRSTGTSDLDEAVGIARRLIIKAEALQEVGISAAGRTFKFVAEKWLEEIDGQVKKGLSRQRMHDDYKAITERFYIPFFGKMQVGKITNKTVGEYEAWRSEYWVTGPGAQQTQQIITRKDGITYRRKTRTGSRGKSDAEETILRQIFKFAVKHDYMDASRMPVVGGEKKARQAGADPNRRPAFTKEQARALLDYAANNLTDGKSDEFAETKRVRVIFHLWLAIVLGTGLRPGKEHQHIKWKHFRWETVDKRNHLFLLIHNDNKTGSRTVRCDPVVEAALLSWQAMGYSCQPDDYVLAHEDGKTAIISFKTQFSSMLEKLNMTEDAMGKPFTPYSLRHTYATLKLNAGMSERLVALNMGTSPEMIRKHYGHDDTVTRANEFVDDLEWQLGKRSDGVL